MALLKKSPPAPPQTVVVVNPQPVQVRAHEREGKDKKPTRQKLRRLLKNPFRGPTNADLEEAELVSDWFKSNQEMAQKIREDE